MQRTVQSLLPELINQLVPVLVEEIKPIITEQMAPILAESISSLVANELKRELLPPIRAIGRVDTVEARLHRDFDCKGKTIWCPVSVPPIVRITFVGLYIQVRPIFGIQLCNDRKFTSGGGYIKHFHLEHEDMPTEYLKRVVSNPLILLGNGLTY